MSSKSFCFGGGSSDEGVKRNNPVNCCVAQETLRDESESVRRSLNPFLRQQKKIHQRKKDTIQCPFGWWIFRDSVASRLNLLVHPMLPIRFRTSHQKPKKYATGIFFFTLFALSGFDSLLFISTTTNTTLLGGIVVGGSSDEGVKRNNPVNCCVAQESLRDESESVRRSLNPFLRQQKKISPTTNTTLLGGIDVGGSSGTRTPDQPVMSRLL